MEWSLDILAHTYTEWPGVGSVYDSVLEVTGCEAAK